MIVRAVQAVLLACGITAAALLSRKSDWAHLDAFALLAACAVLGDLRQLRVGRFHISGSFLAIALAMVLLGPAPTSVLAVGASVFYGLLRRQGLHQQLSNLSMYAVFPLLGAVAWRAAGGPGLLEDGDPLFVLVLLAVYLGSLALNFLMLSLDVRITEGEPFWRAWREVFVPSQPIELSLGLMTAGVAYAYTQQGLLALVLLVAATLLFTYFFATLMRAVQRGEEVEARNRQLASVHLGVITALVRTLALRERMTARHSAAVARYARTMADALGLPDDERERIHTAALFHDIGKFVLPDSILLGEGGLTDEEFELVKQHPVVGADVIGEIEGFQFEANLIRHHHERIDGRGYPDGLAGEEIPLGSRIISVADVYDVITARDTYRTPVSQEEAFAELRRVAGTQLDADLVELFISLVEIRGVRFVHSTASDFEAELAMPRRLADYAEPQRIAA
jgi:putative nucleotidyltransferase with HDIG domain